MRRGSILWMLFCLACISRPALAQWDNLNFETAGEGGTTTDRPGQTEEADDRPELMVFDLQPGEGVSFDDGFLSQLATTLDEALQAQATYHVLSERERRERLLDAGFVVPDEPEDAVLAEAASATRTSRFLVVRIEVADRTHFRVTAVLAQPSATPDQWARAEEASVGRRVEDVRGAVRRVVSEVTGS